MNTEKIMNTETQVKTDEKNNSVKFCREDILLVIESLFYKNNKKPTIKEVAEYLNTYRDNAAYYIRKYNLTDKCNITERGKFKRENNRDILEGIKENLDILVMQNKAKVEAMQISAIIEYMKYIENSGYVNYMRNTYNDEVSDLNDNIKNYIKKLDYAIFDLPILRNEEAYIDELRELSDEN